MGVIDKKTNDRFRKVSIIKSFYKLTTNGNKLSPVELNPFVVHHEEHKYLFNSGWNQQAKIIIKKSDYTSLHALTTAALILPGLFQSTAQAADEDSVDFQYSHYQEGKRDSNLSVEATNALTGESVKLPVPNRRNPIEVDSLHGSARVSLTDRIKFSFNYIEDTWSGATPLGSAPAHSNANNFTRGGVTIDDNGNPVVAGASPYATVNTLLDKNGKPLFMVIDPVGGNTILNQDPTVHVLSFASPETRKQGDFKLRYEWDDAALDLGGGISTERDYESRFVNVGGQMDFNQKQTTVNLGLSYTNSDIAAVLDPEGSLWFSSDNYKDQIEDNKNNGLKTLHGNRQDWATQLNLTQVVNKDAVVDLGMGYTRSTGFMENPDKLSWIFGFVIDANSLPDADGNTAVLGKPFVEQRPDVRNQWHWNARWVQYIEPLDAALHLDYQFAHDDWGINAHTFAADWVQPLGADWVVTPRIRYYSQDAADFYAPFFLSDHPGVDLLEHQNQVITAAKNFSSDQRLSAYGALSGGLTLSKQFTKGIGIEAGVEYYTHQGQLKLGGGGEGSFADFNYWVANAALKVQLDALGSKSFSNSESHSHHGGHGDIPAGVMFGHALAKAGDTMVGYRYMHNWQAGRFLHGDQVITEQQIIEQGCPGRGDFNFDGIQDGCSLLPREMTMSMHMLELMYAPTDWLTLMLMPQFVDMQMLLYQPDSLKIDGEHAGHGGHGAHLHETGGIGDTGMFAMINLFDKPDHHIHATLGVSAPTGDVGIKIKEAGTKNLDGPFIHYGMQLGSGTWDFKPSLTYTGNEDDWSWGTQLVGTKRLEDQNASGYALGDMFEGSLWGGYNLTNWLSTTVRVAYGWQGGIKGSYPRGRRTKEYLTGVCPRYTYIKANDNNFDGIPDGPAFFHQAEYNACLAQPFIKDGLDAADAEDRPTPMDAPKNYGGHYVDLGIGLSATVPSGALAGNKLSFEWLQPIYTNVNGYQLDRDGVLSFTWSYGF